MVSINTNALRQQAEILRMGSKHHRTLGAELNEVIFWLKHQEFGEVEEIRRVLVRQQEDLMKQEKDFLLLSEALWRICDKYENTEHEIIESSERPLWIAGTIEVIDLGNIRKHLSEWGMNTADE